MSKELLQIYGMRIDISAVTVTLTLTCLMAEFLLFNNNQQHLAQGRVDLHI